MAAGKLGKIEALRGFASLYVFTGHAFLPFLGAAGLLLRFGQEVVMCFFLLSGFVIYYATQNARQKSFGIYLLHRLRRIYPTMLVGLVVGFLVAYAAGDRTADLRTLCGNLLMVQDSSIQKPGVWIDTFCGNLPLWSLSYEWWFYMMFFPIYSYVPPRWQLGVAAALSSAGLVSFVIHPNQVSLFLLYFILWWTGLELARTYCTGITPTFATQRASLAVLGAFCVMVPAAMLLLMPRPAHFSYGLHPLLEIRHFLACFLFALLALAWSAARWRFFKQSLGVFAWAAPVSYALYALHYPLCIGSAGIFPGLPAGVRLLVAIPLTFGLAYLVEVPMQLAIVRSTNRLLFSKQPPPEGVHPS